MIFSLCVIAQLCASVLVFSSQDVDNSSQYSTIETVYSNTLRWNSQKDTRTNKYYGFVEPSISVSRINSLSQNATTHLLLVNVQTLLVPGLSENRLTGTDGFFPAKNYSATIGLSASRRMVELPYIGSVRAPSAEVYYKSFAPQVSFQNTSISSTITAGLTFGYSESGGFSAGGNIGVSYTTAYQDTDPAFDGRYTFVNPESASAAWYYSFDQLSNARLPQYSRSFNCSNTLIVEINPLYQGWVDFTLSLTYTMSYDTIIFYNGLPFVVTTYVPMQKTFVFASR